MRIMQQVRAVLLIGAFLAMMFSNFANADEPAPSWMSGVSTWGGGSSVSPTINSKTSPVGAKAPSSTARYTVPQAPSSSPESEVAKKLSEDLAWLESFAASDVVVAVSDAQRSSQSLASSAAAIKPTTSAPSGVAQVAGFQTYSNNPQVPQPPPLDGPILDSGVVGTITEQLKSGMPEESGLPLQEEVLRWYQVPWVWMTTGWTNHAEFGLDGSNGNAETLSLTTGIELKRKTDAYTFAIDVDYRQASNRGATTQDNGRFNVDYDRIIADSNWTMFGKYGMEWDKFKAFDLRLNTNAGLGYYWVRNDQASFITRFGAGASKEIGAPDDAWVPEAVFGAEGERQLTARQKLKGKLEYFPSWEDFGNYRLVADASWEILLDGSDNLSLKLSFTDRYDSTPQGALPNDVYYSALILYKF